MDFEAKIAELGLLIPKPAKPAGSYKPCVIVDNIAYISGQGPLLEDGSFAKGKVGADVDLETAQNHARLCGSLSNQWLFKYDERYFWRDWCSCSSCSRS